jgi:hypothetical protein
LLDEELNLTHRETLSVDASRALDEGIEASVVEEEMEPHRENPIVDASGAIDEGVESSVTRRGDGTSSLETLIVDTSLAIDEFVDPFKASLSPHSFPLTPSSPHLAALEQTIWLTPSLSPSTESVRS